VVMGWGEKTGKRAPGNPRQAADASGSREPGAKRKRWTWLSRAGAQHAESTIEDVARLALTRSALAILHIPHRNDLPDKKAVEFLARNGDGQRAAGTVTNLRLIDTRWQSIRQRAPCDGFNDGLALDWMPAFDQGGGKRRLSGLGCVGSSTIQVGARQGSSLTVCARFPSAYSAEDAMDLGRHPKQERALPGIDYRVERVGQGHPETDNPKARIADVLTQIGLPPFARDFKTRPVRKCWGVATPLPNAGSGFSGAAATSALFMMRRAPQHGGLAARLFPVYLVRTSCWSAMATGWRGATNAWMQVYHDWGPAWSSSNPTNALVSGDHKQ